MKQYLPMLAIAVAITWASNNVPAIRRIIG